MTTLTADRARLFHSLHDPAHPLVLANAWDVASAAVIVAAGAPAIATTSAGVAWSLGVADGDQLGRGVAVEAIARIAGAVNVPVTADIEGGAREPADVADRIAAARQAADRAGVSLFINARTDVFLRGIGPAADRLAETFDRAHPGAGQHHGWAGRTECGRAGTTGGGSREPGFRCRAGSLCGSRTGDASTPERRDL